MVFEIIIQIFIDIKHIFLEMQIKRGSYCKK